MPNATAPARRRTRELDSLTGLSAIDAIGRVRSLELHPAIEPCDGGPGDHGLVLAQDPAAGTELGRGQLVTLLVGECGTPGEPPGAEQPAAGQRRVEPHAFRAQPEPNLEPSAPASSTRFVPHLHSLGYDPQPLIPPTPVPAPAPEPQREPEPPLEPELEEEREPEQQREPDPAPLQPPPGASARPAVAEPRPTARRTSQRRIRRSRRRRMVVGGSVGLAAAATLAVAGTRLPKRTEPSGKRGALTTVASDRGNHRRIARGHRATADQHRAPAARPLPTPRQGAVSAAASLSGPASRTDRPQPRPVTEADALPVRAPAVSPDPVSPVGPVPGPPPSQTGGTP